MRDFQVIFLGRSWVTLVRDIQVVEAVDDKLLHTRFKDLQQMQRAWLAAAELAGAAAQVCVAVNGLRGS